MRYYGFAPYVPVAQRRAKAARYAAALAKKEKRKLAPVELLSGGIAKTFWGKAWCEHLEQFSDFENRLPRGRTYVRNGSVIDLRITSGEIRSIVSGSDLYHIKVSITTLSAAAWKQIKHDCSQAVDSLMELLTGKFDRGIMQRLTQRNDGLFPRPAEIKMSCSCPDYAVLCKHVAATLYGVGARLDREPEVLFTLRKVDPLELVRDASGSENLDRALKGQGAKSLAETDLGELFGIEIESGTGVETDRAATRRTAKKQPAAAAAKKVAIKKLMDKKSRVKKSTVKIITVKTVTVPPRTRSKVTVNGKSTVKVAAKKRPAKPTRPTKKSKRRAGAAT